MGIGALCMAPPTYFASAISVLKWSASMTTGERTDPRACNLSSVDASEIESMFPWWASADEGDLNAPLMRALAWVEGPYARAFAVVEGVTADRLLQIVGKSIRDNPVPRWETPVQMEAWLRGLLQGCLSALP